jgi:indole-3-glycerol phosphate synthase
MSHLEAIVAARRAAVAAVKRDIPARELARLVEKRAGRRDFLDSLRRGRRPLAPAIIAEFKRRSPSAGEFGTVSEPAIAAAAYESGGASAMSVLTEPSAFNGSTDDLRAARAACSLPVLCKDFIVDDYQIWEAAAAGADAVLLIVALLDDVELRSFIALANELGMGALVEVHDVDEAQRAVAAGAATAVAVAIGINNRDLRTFIVDTAVAPRVAAAIGNTYLTVAESGYRGREDVAGCVAANIDAVLVGEALMRASDPASVLREMRGVA